MPDDDYSDIVAATNPAPKLTKTVRGAEKLKGVQPDLINHWNSLQGEFGKAGLSPAIKSGFRTAEQQNSLHRRGYPTKGNDGYINISPHQEGRALDISFSGPQKERGRQIIADYAKRNNLYVPADEPWHLAIPKSQQDDYDDVIKAASGDDYDDVVAAATPKKRQPSIVAALQQLSADVDRRTKAITPRQPSVAEIKREEEQPIGFNRQGGQPSRVTQTADELRVAKGEQPNDRQVYARQQEAQTRLSRMQDESYPERQAREAKDEAWRAANQPEIDRQTKLYREDIQKAKQRGNDADKWLAEFGTQAAGRLMEVAPGDTAKIHSEAALRAAEEEGASRSQLSKGIQSIGAGFIGSAPELGAMALGVPPVAAFAGGSAVRSKSSDPMEVAKAAEHGGLTGLAFETPGIGEGAKQALTKSLGVGATSAGLELAQGASPRDAAVAGATNALMTGIPHLLKNGVPEKPETLSAQLESRGYTLVPEGTQKPPLPRGMRAEKTVDGVIYYDPKRIDAETIRDTPTAELLGHVQEKSPETTETVVARKPDGTEIQSSAVSPENVERQAEVMQGQYPEAKVEQGGNELAQKVIEERLNAGNTTTTTDTAQNEANNRTRGMDAAVLPVEEVASLARETNALRVNPEAEAIGAAPTALEQPQRFQHVDFGEVEATESQEGARTGRVRVAEVADPTKIHYIKKTTLQGRGNERAIPLIPREMQTSIEPPLQPETMADNKVRMEEVKSQLSQPPPEPPEFMRKGEPIASTVKEPPIDTSGSGLGDKPAPSTTAAKLESMSADRAELDLPELPATERKLWQTSLDNARTKGYDKDALGTAESVLRKPRALDDEQTAGLVLKAQEIKNDHATAMEKIAEENDPERLRDLRVSTELLQDQFDTLSDALKQSGSEKGRALAAQKLTINQDYDLTSLMNRYKQKTGKKATGAEKETIERQAATIKDLQERLEAHKENRAQGKTDKFIREQQLQIRRTRRQVTHESLVTERADLKAQIAAEWAKRKQGVQPMGLASIDPEGTLTKLLTQLARNYIQDGVIKATDLVDVVHNDVKDVAELTKREVRDLISGYGRIKKATIDPAEKKLNELKAIMAAQSGKADVLEQGFRPLRRGQQREKPTEDQRRALRELQEAMREHPEISAKPATLEQQATPLDKAKTTTRNRIEQLKQWIADGRREVQGKAVVIPDAELSRLRAEQTMLGRVAARLEDPAADHRMIERRISDLNKSIVSGRKQLVSGHVMPELKEGSKSVWSEKVGRLEKERADVRQQIMKARQAEAKRLREVEAAKPEAQEEAHRKALEQKLKELNKSITETQAKIQSGNVSEAKEGTKSLWSPEISALMKEKQTLSRIAADMRAEAVRKTKTEPSAGFFGATGSWADYEAAARKTLAKQKTQNVLMKKRIAEYERRVSESDFDSRPKTAGVPRDVYGERLAEDLARAKLNYERKLRQWEQQNRSTPEKVADLAIKWGRAAKLSYVSTLGKLGSAATGRMAMSPLENLVGEIPHRLMPKLSAKATTEGGGFSKAAEVAALWKSGRFRQVLNQLRSGASDLDLLYGPRSKMLDKEMSGEGVLGIPGRVHGAMKEYPRQAEFDRQFVKVLKNYETQGRDITEPSTQLAARMEAFNAAERARFQQKNFISDGWNDLMAKWEKKGGAAKATAKVGKFMLPIVRVPVNVASETLNYSLGVPRAAAEHMWRTWRGTMENLSPEKADNIMRAYKKGGVGLAMMAYAFMNPEQFGGYYQPHDKRKPNEPKPGEIMFFGRRIPKVLTHIPILEAAQMAATSRRVFDKLTTKGESKAEALFGGTGAGLKGVAEGIPFYETPARYFTGKEGTQGTAQLLGEQARGMIPGFVQEAAKVTDKGPSGTPAVRRPSGSFAQRFAQTIESGVPGLRQQVPISNVFGNKVTKASDEVERLSVPMVGAVKGADEPPEDFAKREVLQNANIRTQLENVVALPEYDKASDDDKTKWLKQASQFASQQTQDQLPEKPEKKEERQFPMPQAGAGFERAYPVQALEKYERMNTQQRGKVGDVMAQKAWTLTHSPSLSDEQKEEYKARLEALGIVPRPPGERPRTVSRSFRDQLTAQ